MAQTESRDVSGAEREMESNVEQLEERSREFDDNLDGARKTIERNREEAGEADGAVMPAAAGEHEDEDPGPMEADPAGFDDPENLDLDDEDLDDDYDEGDVEDE